MKTGYLIIAILVLLSVWWLGYHEGKGDIGWINELEAQY